MDHIRQRVRPHHLLPKQQLHPSLRFHRVETWELMSYPPLARLAANRFDPKRLCNPLATAVEKYGSIQEVVPYHLNMDSHRSSRRQSRQNMSLRSDPSLQSSQAPLCSKNRSLRSRKLLLAHPQLTSSEWPPKVVLLEPPQVHLHDPTI